MSRSFRPDSALHDLDAPPRKALSEINVTPFVDVMLVLLVLFIATAPLIQQSVRVELPEATARAPEIADHVVLIVIDAKGAITLEGAPVATIEALEQALTIRAQGRDGPPEAQIQADRSLDYGVVLPILARIQRAGVTAVDLISVPERTR